MRLSDDIVPSAGMIVSIAPGRGNAARTAKSRALFLSWEINMYWKSTRKNRASVNRKKASPVQTLEALESRRLLSASTTIVEPLLAISPDASGGAVAGYTPAQIAAAYGFNSVTLSSGIKATGAGQTIAIVDAYNDPNIANDLNVFDQQFGLSAPPSFKVVSQTGSTSALPATDAGWATEISLDVEWAHAMAPGANILLVEANSSSLTDLLAAVHYAGSAQGVSVVSMSWGGSEFSGENSYNSDFVTPTGHRGVTFVAASGDQGSFSGPEWPASSAYVLSVGGTTLNLSSSNTISSETGWSGSTGGASLVEGRPGYQNNVQTSNSRTSPDVAYNADPNTGVAVYDSLNYQGYVGWQEYGGTSEGAPQWAALIAIADQGRAAAGSGALDGSTQTLPDLYALLSNSTTYTNTFNDITSGSSGIFSAAKGYDEVTGLGSPKVNAVVQALIGDGTASVALTTTTATTTSGGGGRTRGRRDIQADPAAVVARQNDAVFNSTQQTTTTKILDAAAGHRFTADPAILVFSSIDATFSALSSSSPSYVFSTPPLEDVKTISLAIPSGGALSQASSAVETKPARRPMDLAAATITSSGPFEATSIKSDGQPSDRWEPLLLEAVAAVVVGIYFVKDSFLNAGLASGNARDIFSMEPIVG
jgi:hypothetical protein